MDSLQEQISACYTDLAQTKIIQWSHGSLKEIWYGGDEISLSMPL